MRPHVNRCFGFMAMALGMDYWLVPQLSSFYYGNYNATNDNVAAVIRLLRHVIKLKGLDQYLAMPDVHLDEEGSQLSSTKDEVQNLRSFDFKVAGKNNEAFYRGFRIFL